MKVKKILDVLSGFLFFFAFLPYIFSILDHQTVPSPASWAIWASVDTLALLAMSKKDVGRGQITGAVAGAWIITALAIIFGNPTIGSIEIVSLIGAMIGITLWKKTNNAVIAIVCSQIAVFIAAIPTFVHAYTNPTQEDPVAWSIWFVSCICALFAIRKWDLANALQPLTFTLIETTMIVLIVILPFF